MKNLFYFIAFTFLFLFSCVKKNVKNINPNASIEAKKLLNFLYDIQWQYTLSGQHNFIATGSKYTELIKEKTGKSPVVWGSDFSFCYEGDEPSRFQHCGPLNLLDPENRGFLEKQSQDSIFTHLTPQLAREKLVKNAIEKYRQGYIITLMWHACPPGYGDCCNGKKIWAME